jgi:hypothetical protein
MEKQNFNLFILLSFSLVCNDFSRIQMNLHSSEEETNDDEVDL